MMRVIKIVRIVICDNDEKYLIKLKSIIQTLFKSYECDTVIHTYSSGQELIKDIKKNNLTFDIIFLDVEMPIIDGFGTANELRKLEGDFTLIFLTNMEAYAIEGYKYDAFRYILKNNLEKDVEEAIQKFIIKSNDIRLSEEQVALKIKQEAFYDTIFVSKKDILYFAVDSKKRVRLYTANTSFNLLILPLKKYKDMLIDNNFEIIMRSYLINFDQIKDVDEEHFILSNGAKIHLGYSKRVRDAALKKYMIYKNERL
jgi:DNA-binding LytR/AlgR family response regulator